MNLDPRRTKPVADVLGAGPRVTRSLDAGSVAESQSRLLGIALFCGALMCFSGTDTSAKWLIRSLPVLEVVWARYFLSAVFSYAALKVWQQPRRLFATRRPGLQLLRSALLLGSTTLAFESLRNLQLAEATSISFSTPLVVALLAGPVLGEWVGPRRLLAICVGFVGVLVVTRPGAATFNPAVLFAVGGVLCNSCYYLVTRMLAATDTADTILAYTPVAGVALLTPLLPWFGQMPADWLSVALMIVTGFCGGLSQWLVILAHRRAPAAILAPFIYIQIIWTTVIGFVVFGDFPRRSTFVGAAIVVASGLYLWYRERRTASRLERTG